MRDRILNSIGIVFAAAGFMAALVYHFFSGATAPQKPQKAIIRIAHWQLESGVRTAFDELASNYMRLHPEVEVQQLPIPESIYANWLVTQLVGETAPDLIEIRLDASTNDERIARYFVPLTDLANSKNPYNRGTELEQTPLRRTFLDGMKGGYFENLLDYYAVPMSWPTVRMYYNLDLLKDLSGSAHLPDNYTAWSQLCASVRNYAASQHRPVVPIAGSKSNGPALLYRLFNSQTQRLMERLDPVGLMSENETEGAVRRADDYLQRRWTLRSPEIESGFQLMREVALEMQPGFTQTERDDATLRFLRGQALTISTGSWDAATLRAEASFKVGVAALPFPAAGDEAYGKYTYGLPSEAGNKSSASFGLTRASANPEVAKDFLRYLSSQPANQIWSQATQWPPVIKGVKVPPETVPFLPERNGYIAGIPPNVSPVGFLELSRCLSTHLHLLVGPKGSAREFLEAIEPLFGQAMIADLRRMMHDQENNRQRSDTQFAALAWLSDQGTADTSASARLDQFLQASTLSDRRYFQTRLVLQTSAQKREK